MGFRQINFVFLLVSFSLVCSCGKDDEKKVNCAKSSLAISLESVSPSSSCSSADGEIRVAVSGGKEPYKFRANGALMEGPDLVGLLPGVYTIVAEDRLGCERALENVVILAEGLVFDVDITPDTECLDGNGVVTINVETGTPPYQYKHENGAFTDLNVFDELNQGIHNLTLKDGNGCTVPLSVSVPKGFTGTSFQNEILPMIKTFCATSQCHDGDPRVDLRVYANAKKHAAEIKSLTRSRDMPFEGSLTQNQIELFTCWVDDGALDN